jgi:hypothetical protein
MLAAVLRRIGIVVSEARLNQAASILRQTLDDWRQLPDLVRLDSDPLAPAEEADAMD